MKSRSLLTLTALVAIVVAAAIWVSVSHQSKTEHTDTLYPGLKAKLDDLQAVRIYGASNQRKVELVRTQDTWGVTERSKYPAATDKVRQLVLDLGEAKSIEEKTSNPANYAALGVEDVTTDAASGVRIELVGPSGIDLIVGKQGPSMHSRYVRKAGQKTSWLVDRLLEAPSEPKAWLDPKLIDIAANRLQSAHVAIGGKQPYTAAKSRREDAHFAVTGLKKGQALSTESAADAIGSALVSLNLEDVAPYKEWQDKPAQAQARYETFDGLLVELSGWTDGTAHHIHARARYDEQLAAQFAPKSDGKSAKTMPDHKAEAAALDARLQPWVFQIADYKYGAIFTPIEDLLHK